MGAPKGHPPYNIGCKTGRKPINRDEKADDLIKWVQDENNWTIKAWRIKHMITRDRVMDMCNDSKKFHDAYAYALDVIALRREKMNHNDEMKDSLYSQHLKVYDRDRSEYDEAIKDRQLIRDLKKIKEEIELKAKNGTATPEDLQKLASTFGLVDQLQALVDRKIAAKTINADAKS